MKKIISFLLLALMVNLAAFGQQDPQFTNYMFYKLGMNPGYAGAEGAISGVILNRYQWEGLMGAPKTLVFSAEAAIDAFGSPGGVGLNVVSDEGGFSKTSQVNLNYAYQKTLATGKLGIGISLGVLNQEFNPGELISPDDVLNGSSGATGDELIPQSEVSQMAFDAGFGLYLSSNKYFLGASVTHINQAALMLGDVENYFLVRHYYLNGGYNIRLANPLFQLRPSFLLKSDLAGWQLDMNTNVVYDDRIWAGISYRIQDAIALLIGMEMENGLRFGYSFDLVTSAIKRNGLGSHEIFVSYSLNLEKNRSQKYKSIRFL